MGRPANGALTHVVAPALRQVLLGFLEVPGPAIGLAQRILNQRRPRLELEGLLEMLDGGAPLSALDSDLAQAFFAKSMARPATVPAIRPRVMSFTAREG